jgi:hypothetical protein
LNNKTYFKGKKIFHIDFFILITKMNYDIIHLGQTGRNLLQFIGEIKASMYEDVSAKDGKTRHGSSGVGHPGCVPMGLSSGARSSPIYWCVVHYGKNLSEPFLI